MRGKPLALGSRRSRGNDHPEQIGPQVSAPGAIGAAVVKASRRSARLTQRGLARQLGISAATVRSWENGIAPLYCVDYGQLRHLAGALGRENAPQALRKLVLASQCDLLITGMLRGFEDYAEVPPIDEDTADGETVRALLRWALTGVPPQRGRSRRSADPLLAGHDVTRIRALALLLQARPEGPDLAAFGGALAGLARRSDREE